MRIYIASIVCFFIWVIVGSLRAERSSHWTRISFIWFALLFFLPGCFLCWEQYELQQRTTAKTQGTVTKFNAHYIKGSKCIVAVLTYKSSDGSVFNCKSTAYALSSYYLGAVRTVYYNPQNPKESRLDSFTETWMHPLIFLIGGFGLLNVGVFGTFKKS